MNGCRKLLLSILTVLVLVSCASAKSYIPNEFGNSYPLVFHWEQSDAVDAHVAKRTGPASFTDESLFEKPYSIGPPGDYDGDDKIEYPVRSQNGAPYLKFYDKSGNQDFNLSNKPKSGSMLAAGYLDKDGKTDLLFKNQNGDDMSAVDSDGESKEYTISSFGDPIDVADIDTDGREEVVYSDTSAVVKYYDLETQSSTDIDPGNDKANSYSNIADIDEDGTLEYVYATGSSTVYSADVNGQDQQIGDLSSAKVTPEAIFYTGSELKAFVAGNSNNVEVCTVDSCSSANRKSSGARSVIPPLTKTPETNLTNEKIDQGKTVSVSFNVSDFEGYSDIVNETAITNFTDPSGNHFISDATESTSNSGVPGNTANGNFVPTDSKTKTFKAAYKIPDDAETGEWNVTVQVKDEKMTGTKNWTTFQVEKSLVEKNVSQGISIGEKDMARDTDLTKVESTGMSFVSPNSILTVKNRKLADTLGFSRGRERTTDLSNSVLIGLSFSRTGSSFKSNFPIFGSTWSAGSTVADVYATAITITPGIGFSGAYSRKGIYSAILSDDYIFADTQEKSIFRTLELILGYSEAPNRERGLQRDSSTGLSIGNSPSTVLELSRSLGTTYSLTPSLGTFLDLNRVFTSLLDTGTDSSSELDLGREQNQSITTISQPSNTLTTISDGVFVLIQQGLGIGQSQQDMMDASRGQEEALDTSSEVSSSKSFMRSVSETLNIDLGLQDLIDYILEFFTDEEEDGGDDGSGGGSDESITGVSGSINDIQDSNKTRNGTSKEESLDKSDNDSTPEGGVEQIKEVEASLKKVDSGIKKVETVLGQVEEDEEVTFYIREDEQTADDSESEDPIKLEEIRFEVSEPDNWTKVQIKEMDEVEQLNISEEREIVEILNISTSFETQNASIRYKVEKEFIRSRNSSPQDIELIRYKQGERKSVLDTKVVRERETFYRVEARSQEGFSVFVVNLNRKKETIDAGEAFSLPEIPFFTATKVILLMFSLYLVRRPLSKGILTSDIRFIYWKEKIRYMLLKSYRRIERWSDADTGRKELELIQDVRSLENKKEVLEFRRNKIEKEVEKKEKIRNRYEIQLMELSNTVDKWKEKLRS